MITGLKYVDVRNRLTGVKCVDIHLITSVCGLTSLC